jgi:hypothetical protein
LRRIYKPLVYQLVSGPDTAYAERERLMPYFFTGLGALNCPGDPGCPGYVDPAINEVLSQACTCVSGICQENGNSCSDVPLAGPIGSPAYIAQQNALTAAALKLQNAAPFSLTAWLNANSDMVMIGGAAAVGALFLSSSGGLLGGRR